MSNNKHNGLQTLATVHPNGSFLVSSVKTSADQKHRLAVLGIRNGTTISLERRDYRGAIVHVGNSRLALGKEMLADISVSSYT